MVKSLQLDPKTWDITLDGNNDLAIFGGKLRVAQDVATETRLNMGEAYFEPDNGVPYVSEVFSMSAQEAIIKSYMENQALKVPNVTGITSIAFKNIKNRTLEGDIQVTDDIVEDA